MGLFRNVLCAVIVTSILVFGSVFKENISPTSEAQVSTTLTITATAAGGYDIFPYSISGPTTYNTSIFTNIFVSGINGFMASDGPRPVDPGIYSIQELVPAGWTFSNAICTDGTQLLGGDTVTGIVINPGDNIECTFENTILTPDADNDGIWNIIDPLREIESDDFTDMSFGGTTSGTITTRGDQRLTIIDNNNPAGVEIVSDSSGLSTPATVSVCGGIATIDFDISEEVGVTCGSATIDVNFGSVDITFIGSGGIQATTTMSIGNSITFDQDTFSFTVPVTNTQNIIIDIDGTLVTLLPGSTESFGFLKITKLTTGGGDTFDFSVTGPTSYNPSINTANGGVSSYDNLGTLSSNANAFYFENDVQSDFLPLTVAPKLNEGVYQKGLATDAVFGEIRFGDEADKTQWKFFHNDNVQDLVSINLWVNGDLVGSPYYPILATIDNNGAPANGFVWQTQLGTRQIVSVYANGATQIFNIYTGVPPDDGQWHMMTLLMDLDTGANTFARLYIDGVINPDYSGQLPTVSFSGSNNFGVGGDPDSTLILGGHASDIAPVTENGFNVDDVAIWSGHYLTPLEITTMYNAGVGSAAQSVSPSTLVGYWSFDDSTVNAGSGGGMGMNGPTPVHSGTYSIQETIPAGWNLTTATCNDGFSSFSADTVSGIVVDPDDNIQCTFENAFAVSTPDTDGDGIYNDVDTLPTTSSDDFSDIALGGTSSGTITARGNQILTITEEPNPAGVRINADVSGGLLPAVVNVCGGASKIALSTGDKIVVTCGSVTIDVIDGPVDVTFTSSGGTPATTSITAGNSITFDPVTFSFSVPSTNVDPVVVIVEGQQITINAGEGASILSSNKDSFLKQGELNTNEGANTMMRVRDSGNNRALVSFDQNEILSAAQGKTLSSATLRLYIEENGNNWGPNGRTIDIHRLLADWTEGNGFNDKPASMTLSQFNSIKNRGNGLGVTWKCATDTVINNQQTNCSPQWNGATFSPTPTDTITIFKDNLPTYTVKTVGWIEFDVTADLQAFLNTAQNYGWIVKKTQEGESGLVEFTSDESATNMPELVLVFD